MSTEPNRIHVPTRLVSPTSGRETPTRSQSIKRKTSINVPSRTGSSGRLPDWAGSQSLGSSGAPASPMMSPSRRAMPRRPSNLAGGSLVDVTFMDGSQPGSMDSLKEVLYEKSRSLNLSEVNGANGSTGNINSGIHTKRPSALATQSMSGWSSSESRLNSNTSIDNSNGNISTVSSSIITNKFLHQSSYLQDNMLSSHTSIVPPPRITLPKRTTQFKTQIDSILESTSLELQQPNANYEQILDKYYEALDLAKKDNDLILQSKCLSNISCLFRRMGNNDSSYITIKEAWGLTSDYVEDSCRKGVSVWLRMVVDIVETEFNGEHDLLLNSHASDRNFEDDEFARGPPLVIWFLQLLTNMGNSHVAVGKVEEALKYYTLGLDLATDILEEYPLPSKFTTVIGNDLGSRKASAHGRSLNRSVSVRVSAHREHSKKKSVETDNTLSVNSSQRSRPPSSNEHGQKTKVKLSFLHRETVLSISRLKTHIGVCYQLLGIDQVAMGYQKDALANVLAYVKDKKLNIDSKTKLLNSKKVYAYSFVEAEACIRANIGSVYQTKGEVALAWQFHENARLIYSILGNNAALTRETVNISGLYAEVGKISDSLQWVHNSKNIVESAMSREDPNDEEFLKKSFEKYWREPSFAGQLQRLQSGKNLSRHNPDTTSFIYGIQMYDKSIVGLFDQEEELRRTEDFEGLMFMWMNAANTYFHLQNPFLGLYFLGHVLCESKYLREKELNHLKSLRKLAVFDLDDDTVGEFVKELNERSVIPENIKPHLMFLLSQGFHLLSLLPNESDKVLDYRLKTSGTRIRDFGTGYEVLAGELISNLVKELKFTNWKLDGLSKSGLTLLLNEAQQKFETLFDNRKAITEKVMRNAKDFDLYRQYVCGIMATKLKMKVTGNVGKEVDFDSLAKELAAVLVPVLVSIIESRPFSPTETSPTSGSHHRQLSVFSEASSFRHQSSLTPVLKSPFTGSIEYFNTLKIEENKEVFLKLNELLNLDNSNIISEESNKGFTSDNIHTLNASGASLLLLTLDIINFLKLQFNLKDSDKFPLDTVFANTVVQATKKKLTESLGLCECCNNEVVEGYENYVVTLEKKATLGTDLKRTNTKKGRLTRTFSISDRASRAGSHERSLSIVPQEESEVADTPISVASTIATPSSIATPSTPPLSSKFKKSKDEKRKSFKSGLFMGAFSGITGGNSDSRNKSNHNIADKSSNAVDVNSSSATVNDVANSDKESNASPMLTHSDSLKSILDSVAYPMSKKKQREGVLEFSFPSLSQNENARRLFNGPEELVTANVVVKGHKSNRSTLDRMSVSADSRSSSPRRHGRMSTTSINNIADTQSSSFAVLSSGNIGGGFHVHGIRSSTTDLVGSASKEAQMESAYVAASGESGSRLQRNMSILNQARNGASSGSIASNNMSFPCQHYSTFVTDTIFSTYAV